METWYVVYKTGYSDTESARVRFDHEPDAYEVADYLEIDADKITLIEKAG